MAAILRAQDGRDCPAVNVALARGDVIGDVPSPRVGGIEPSAKIIGERLKLRARCGAGTL